MGLLDGIKRTLDTTSKKLKYSKREKEIKEAMLMRFAMWQLERVCIAKKISLKVKGKKGERKARSKTELVPKLLKLEVRDIVKYAKKYNVKYEDLLEELEIAKKEIFGE